MAEPNEDEKRRAQKRYPSLDLEDTLIRACERRAHAFGLADNRERAEKAEQEIATLAAAVEAYDRAVESCANDPERMASFCSAEGEDLDRLYLRMRDLAKAVLSKGEIEATRANPVCRDCGENGHWDCR
jgi:hypothetical protein